MQALQGEGGQGRIWTRATCYAGYIVLSGPRAR